MLVLTRKNGESVQIGNAIAVKVLAISGNQVKLGFSAPREVPIRREELIATVSVPLDRWQDEPVESESRSLTIC